MMLTPEATHCLESIPFAQKRVKDLQAYLEELYKKAQSGEMPLERFDELERSCWGLYTWWTNHLNRLIDNA